MKIVLGYSWSDIGGVLFAYSIISIACIFAPPLFESVWFAINFLLTLLALSGIVKFGIVEIDPESQDPLEQAEENNHDSKEAQ